MNKKEEVRQVLIRARKERGMTRFDFSKLIGVSERTLISWEQGSRLPENVEIIDQALSRVNRTVTLGR